MPPFISETYLLRLTQFLFFAALVVVVAATVMPVPSMPVSVTWNDKILHFIAYFGLGILGGTGWPARRYALLLTMPLFGMALEAAQGVMAIGRYFEWYDGIANALGAFAGVAASLAVRRILFRAP